MLACEPARLLCAGKGSTGLGLVAEGCLGGREAGGEERLFQDRKRFRFYRSRISVRHIPRCVGCFIVRGFSLFADLFFVGMVRQNVLRICLKTGSGNKSGNERARGSKSHLSML